ncbi:hypothetical protein BKG75_16210 [Mycobacteroides chelonae]|nr:hypothetical protein BKG75_16210 [Mycobacteroides chelonae]
MGPIGDTVVPMTEVLKSLTGLDSCAQTGMRIRVFDWFADSGLRPIQMLSPVPARIGAWHGAQGSRSMSRC